MEFIIEFVLDLLFEGGQEICRNQKISKWIRYPVLVLIALMFAAVVLLLFVLSWTMWDESVPGSLLIAAIGIALTAAIVIKVRKEYLKHYR